MIGQHWSLGGGGVKGQFQMPSGQLALARSAGSSMLILDQCWFVFVINVVVDLIIDLDVNLQKVVFT